MKKVLIMSLLFITVLLLREYLKAMREIEI